MTIKSLDLLEETIKKRIEESFKDGYRMGWKDGYELALSEMPEEKEE